MFVNLLYVAPKFPQLEAKHSCPYGLPVQIQLSRCRYILLVHAEPTGIITTVSLLEHRSSSIALSLMTTRAAPRTHRIPDRPRLHTPRQGVYVMPAPPQQKLER